jgi:hypothetical protein
LYFALAVTTTQEEYCIFGGLFKHLKMKQVVNISRSHGALYHTDGAKIIPLLKKIALQYLSRRKAYPSTKEKKVHVC